MCNNNKLCVFCQLPQIIRVAADVGLIQCRLDLVQQAEGRRLQVLDRKKQGDGSERLLPAGKLHHILQLFARWLGDDTDSRLQDILLRHQLKPSVSSAEKLFERFVKFPLDQGKPFQELASHSLIQIPDHLQKGFFCFHQVVMLPFQEIVSF